MRIPNISGNLDPNAEIQAGIGINAPYGVAIDPSGNLYVSDSNAGAAYQLARSNVTLPFGSWAVGAMGGPYSLEVENAGNQPLTLDTPWYSSAGNTGDFSVSAAASDSCASGASIAVGDSCSLYATFTPDCGRRAVRCPHLGQQCHHPLSGAGNPHRYGQHSR